MASSSPGLSELDLRGEFHIPRGVDGSEKVYLLGNSLGLQPQAAEGLVLEELHRWSTLAADAHSQGKTAWISYHELVAPQLARLVGGRDEEVVAMNSLTVNLHLMLATFYRPVGERNGILMEKLPFPSDYHAIVTYLCHLGVDVARGLRVIEADSASGLLDEDRICEMIEAQRETLALVLLPGVHFLTGQRLDIPRITRVAREFGIPIGWDLAHAVGNIPLDLHDWDVDFAVWCSYKYLNAGPGAVGGCFIHHRHATRVDLPRLGGWWGHDKRTRFKMEPRFDPMPTAEGWQLSNPPILALAPLRASLDLFDRFGGMHPLRRKSTFLMADLERRIENELEGLMEIVTPRDPAARGCQFSLRLMPSAFAQSTSKHGRQLVEQLAQRGIVTDFREPNIVRLALAPLYNRTSDAEAFVGTVKELLHG